MLKNIVATMVFTRISNRPKIFESFDVFCRFYLMEITQRGLKGAQALYLTSGKSGTKTLKPRSIPKGFRSKVSA